MGMVDVAGLASGLPAAADFSGPMVVYGAGYNGGFVTRYLAERGIGISAVVDDAARAGQTCGGIPVVTPAQWLAGNAPAAHQCLVAMHNRDVAMVPLLQRLRASGFRDVFTMIDFVNAFPEGQPFRFWLVPGAFYRDKQASIDAMLGLLADGPSRDWAAGILRMRIHGDYGALPAPSGADQYFPSDLPRWPEPLRLVDCGAYDGDTIAKFMAAGYRLDAVAAFEPDLDNFAKLAGRFGELDITNIPCGVSSDTRVLRFQAGCGEASRVVDEGDSMIQCVALDDAIPAFAPTLLKMDTEGAEIEALHGARRLIARYRPSLAISLYHLPEHLWEIPLLIDSWQLGYRFHIRGHAHNSFDSVLYAVQ